MYADNRPYKTYVRGLAAAASKLSELDSAIKPLFHPFRFLVVGHYRQTCRLPASPSFLASSSLVRQIRKDLDHSRRHSGSARSISGFAKANAIVALAVASEPWSYPRIFNRWRLSLGEKAYFSALDTHWEELEAVYQKVGEVPIRQCWESLCDAATALEPNQRLHELLRLSQPDVREKRLKGPIGGALFLKAQAETLRRVAEATFGTKWPEEGQGWDRGYKKHAYGADRIFDGNRKVAREVLRSFWPTLGLHATWYVEGNTEFGALKEFFGDEPVGLDIVNLRGRVGERGGRRLDDRLLDLLGNDRKNGIYSIVSLDGDVLDNLKRLQQAAKNEDFFGLAHISRPDFEFANFSLGELQEVLWSIAEEDGAPPESRAQLIHNTAGAGSKGELEKGARKVSHLNQFSTNEDWGRRLMRFAKQNPKRGDGAEGAIVRAVHDGRRAAHGLFNHRSDIQRRRVDPDSLQLVERT